MKIVLYTKNLQKNWQQFLTIFFHNKIYKFSKKKNQNKFIRKYEFFLVVNVTSQKLDNLKLNKASHT